MIIDYESPSVEIAKISDVQIMCASRDGSWEDIDREEDDFQKYQPTRVRMRDYYGKGNHSVREKHYSHDTGFWRELERFLKK